MEKYVKTEIPGLCRADSGALVNVDNEGLKAYKIKKKKFKQIDDLERRVAVLEEIVKSFGHLNDS